GGRARHEQREKQPTVREAWRHLGIPSPSRREGSVGADLARLRTIGQVNSEPDGCRRAGPRRGGRDLTRDSPQVPRTQPRPCEASVEMCDFCEDSVRSPVPSVALGGGTSMFDGLGTLARTHAASAATTLTALLLSLCVAGPAAAVCGDQLLDPGEQCDLGPQNGAPGSCCTGACTFRPAGDLCRLPAASCDVAESCTGYGGQCPPDGSVPANQCRPTVTLTSGAPPNMSADMAAVLETNAAAAQTYMSGTFNAVRGGAKILNFDANGTQAWVA